MNCKIFTDNLEKYILDDLCYDFKIQMEEHMKFCSYCRELYEDEILFEQAIEEVLGFEKINFTSQKDNIMSKINIDKYKEVEITKKSIDCVKYIKVSTAVAAAVAVLIINPTIKSKVNTVVLNKLISINEKIENKAMVSEDSIKKSNIMDSVENKQKIEGEKQEEIKKTEEKTEEKKEIINIKEEEQIAVVSEDTGKIEISNNDSKEEKLESIPNMDFEDEEGNDYISMSIMSEEDLKIESLNTSIELKKIYIESNRELSSKLMKQESKWKDSPNKKLSYSTEAKESKEINQLSIKNLENEDEWIFQVPDNKDKVEIKYAKWRDDKTLFIVHSITGEDSVQYEEVYIMNVNNGKGLTIYRTETEDINIVDVEKNYENDSQVILKTKENGNDDESSLEKYTIYNVQNDIID